jgi:hypothetical protein
MQDLAPKKSALGEFDIRCLLDRVPAVPSRPQIGQSLSVRQPPGQIFGSKNAWRKAMPGSWHITRRAVHAHRGGFRGRRN